MPPRVIQKIFPPIVTGPTVMLIGVTLIGSGFQNGQVEMVSALRGQLEGFFQLCPDYTAPHALPWGSAQYIGLGFSVFITILLCERFGSPIMKSTSVVIGLLTGCIYRCCNGLFRSFWNRLRSSNIFHLGLYFQTPGLRSPSASIDGHIHHLCL